MWWGPAPRGATPIWMHVDVHVVSQCSSPFAGRVIATSRMNATTRYNRDSGSTIVHAGAATCKGVASLLQLAHPLPGSGGSNTICSDHQHNVCGNKPMCTTELRATATHTLGYRTVHNETHSTTGPWFCLTQSCGSNLHSSQRTTPATQAEKHSRWQQP
jgi:hypothetical protein